MYALRSVRGIAAAHGLHWEVAASSNLLELCHLRSPPAAEGRRQHSTALRQAALRVHQGAADCAQSDMPTHSGRALYATRQGAAAWGAGHGSAWGARSWASSARGTAADGPRPHGDDTTTERQHHTQPLTDAQLAATLRACLPEAEGKALLGGGSALQRALTEFRTAVGTDGGVTQERLETVLRLVDATQETEQPLTLADLLREGAPQAMVLAVLHLSVQGVKPETQAFMLQLFADAQPRRSDGAPPPPPNDSMLLFLTRHLALLQGADTGSRDAVLRQLLEVYQLQSQPAKRSFESSTPTSLPPEVAWSAMKPLGQEISHRVGAMINLFAPQRITLGAYVDLTKVVRPLRAKNFAKRLRYRNLDDIYYREP